MKRPLPISIAKNLTDRVATDSADALLKAAHAGNKGLAQRLAGLDLPSTPCVYQAAQVYKPEVGSMLVDTSQDGSSSVSVNYVLRTGQDYQIPIICGGDGIFLAHSVRCTVWQTYKDTAFKRPVQLTVVPMTNDLSTATTAEVNWTTKFSIIGTQPANGSPPAMNYRWNLQDMQSGTFYSDNYLPLGALQNRSMMEMHTLEGQDDLYVLTDGGEHEFDAPFRFEHAQVMVFIFRPLTDIYQLASLGNGENSQPVTVQVELIGERIGGST